MSYQLSSVCVTAEKLLLLYISADNK